MTTTQMIISTNKIRRGDTLVQQVPDYDSPYREVTLTENPVMAEVLYHGVPHEVRYLTGYDAVARREVKLVGTEYQLWQILREH